jgi:hypothetical protein
MKKFDLSNFTLQESDGVLILKNDYTTVGFVRFNSESEIEYIFVNPIFRKQGLAKKLLKMVEKKTCKKIIFQDPISPLGEKLLQSLDKCN